LEKDDVYVELEELVGQEAATRLTEHYSGSSLYFPRSIGRNRRHRKIKEEFKRGASYKELARRYSLTERHIRRIVHKRKPKASQNNP